MCRLKSTRGSVLLVALMFSAILAISLTSYLKLALNASNLANRSFYFNAALNLTDIGIERALWSLNDQRFNAAPNNWTTRGGFTQVSATEYYGTFPSASDYYSFSGGAKGQVKVRATVQNPGDPPANFIWKTVAQGIVTLGDGTTMTKIAECYLRQRSWAEKGMVAKEGIQFTGNGAMVDSWRSRYPAISDDVPYSTNVGVRRAEATLAAMDFVAIQTGDIFGYVSLGESTIAGNLTWQNNNGTLDDDSSNTFAQGAVDTASRVTLDYVTNFPEVEPIPSGGTAHGAINGSAVLSNGTHTTPSISLQNNEMLEIGASGNVTVTLVVAGNLSMQGSSKIKVYPGSSLTAYIGGDISMGGNNVAIESGTATVPANPDRCVILGTRTSAQIATNQLQDWDFNGDGNLSAMIYAPYANVDMKGNGHIFGSVVGNSFLMSGNGAFHQDESLANFRNSGIWGLSKWRELVSASDRATVASLLNF